MSEASAQNHTVADGNTKKDIRYRMWCFTLNNYTKEDISTIITYFSSASQYAFQEEKCPTTGTPHLQGAVYFRDAKTFSALKNIWPRAHWEKMKKQKNAFNYCLKEDTRAGEQFTKGIVIPLRLCLYDWQKRVIDEIKQKPDDRKIVWFYNEIGNAGKTTFCKYLVENFSNVLYLNGKANDMKYGIVKYMEKNDPPKILLVDLSRSLENFVSYEGIECIKNGIFFSGKYESQMVCYPNPHLYVFANFKPDLDKLSKDRWDIRII